MSHCFPCLLECTYFLGQKDGYLFDDVSGTGIQSHGSCSRLQDVVMVDGSCHSLDDFPTILDAQKWQSKAALVEEGWIPVTTKRSKKSLPQFDMNLRSHKKGVKSKY